MSAVNHSYKYSRPALTVDCVVFGINSQSIETLEVLLVCRGKAPFEGSWALPGGFVRTEDVSLESAARRELEEETGVNLNDIFLEQLYTFGTKDRDPREWTASVAYYALVNLDEYMLIAATDAIEAKWFAIDSLPALAFDHREILDRALNRLRTKIRYEPIGFELLPRKFTLPQLQQLYETILGHKLDRRNFLRKFRKMDLLIELEETQEGVSHRPAKLYQFDEQKYRQLKEKGFNFEI